MDYATTKWATAKAKALAAASNMRAAKFSAAEKIKRECGQDAFPGYEQPWCGPKHGVVYPFVTGSKLDPADHWNCSLADLDAIVENMRQWVYPEKWEALWASRQ